MKSPRIFVHTILVCLVVVAQLYATPAPTGLTVIRGAGPATFVTLNWNGTASMGTYRVYRTTSLPVILSPANLVQSLPAINSQGTWQDPLGPTPPYYYAVTEDDLGSGESSLSNTAGYIAFEALGGGGYPNVMTTFGVPFVTWDAPAGVAIYGVYADSVKDVIIDQVVCGTATVGDRVVAPVGGALTYYRCSPPPNSWQGPLNRLNPAQVYYLDKRGGHPTQTVVIAGEVDNSSSHYSASLLIPAPVLPQPSTITWFSWPDARTLPMDQLELYSSGINTGATAADADLIISLGPVDAGEIAFCTGSGVWGGTLTQVVPGQAYLIINQGPNSWNYTYSYSLTN